MKVAMNGAMDLPAADALQMEQYLRKAAAHPTDRVYALVDGALLPEAWTRLKSSVRCSLLVPPGVQRQGLAPDGLPFLVELARERGHWESTLQQLFSLARQQPGVSFLISTLASAELADSLAARTVVELPGGLTAFLRFADARVLPALHEALEPDQREAFFGQVVSAWIWPDRSMVWQRLAWLASENSTLSGDQPQAYAPLALSDVQENALLQAAKPDTLRPLLQEHAPELLDGMDGQMSYEWIKTAIGEAEAWNLHSPMHQLQFCLLRGELKPGFDQAPAWRIALEEVKAGRLDLAAAARRVNDQSPEE
jgi:hypothetical protein